MFVVQPHKNLLVMNIRDKENEELLSALKEVGIEAGGIYDLVSERNSYRKGIPVLIQKLKNGVQDRALKEGIIRALGAKEARKTEAAKVLAEEYHKLPKDEEIMRWTIGNTFSIIAEDQDFKTISKIVSDPSNGKSREMFVASLSRLKLAEAESLLITLLDDDEVSAHALNALGKKRSLAARTKIEALTGHPNKLIRKEALRAIKRIDK